MSKIATKWIADAAATNDKVNADVAGAGLSGGAGSALSVDYGSASDTACEGDDSRLAFGENFSENSSEGESSTSSTSMQQKVRLTTPSLAVGFYKIAWSFLCRQDGTSNDFRAQVQVDDSDMLWESQEEMKDAGANQKIPVAGWSIYEVTGAGSIDIDLDYCQTSTDTAYIWGARLLCFRVS